MKIIIDGVYFKKNRTFPSLNDYISACRTNPIVGAKMKKDFQSIAELEINRQAGGEHFENPVEIEYRFYESDGRRDCSNVESFFVKVFEDALQECGVIDDDDQKHLRGFTNRFFIDKENPRVEVEIEEVNV